jgi:hypothetical protein
MIPWGSEHPRARQKVAGCESPECSPAPPNTTTRYGTTGTRSRVDSTVHFATICSYQERSAPTTLSLFPTTPPNLISLGEFYSGLQVKHCTDLAPTAHVRHTGSPQAESAPTSRVSRSLKGRDLRWRVVRRLRLTFRGTTPLFLPPQNACARPYSTNSFGPGRAHKTKPRQKQWSG